MSHIVLNEMLLREFLKFYLQQADVDRTRVSSLFCKLQPFLLTTSQLVACGIEDRLAQQRIIDSGPWISHPPSDTSWGAFDPALMQELVTASKLKFMLTHNVVSGAPYKTVSVNSQKQDQLSFAATYKPREDRTTAINHLQALMEGATQYIYLIDRHLDAQDAQGIAGMMHHLAAGVQVQFFVGDTTSNTQSTLKTALCSQTHMQTLDSLRRLKVKPYTHDRYIQIDGVLEIILSSGFRYLFNNEKDFTYVIRVIS